MPHFRALADAVKDVTGQHGAILCTYDEAVSVAKSRKVRRFAARFQPQAPSRTTPGYGRTVYGLLWITRKQALELLHSAYRHPRDKVLVEMNLHGSSLFIG